MPSSSVGKSCTRTGGGVPFGCHSRPAFLKFPTSSFFFVSTEIRVTATDRGGSSATQSFTVTVVATTTSFTDHPIQPGVTPVKAIHCTELRMRIDALRRGAGLAAFSWTDPVLMAGVTSIRRMHLLELRQALAEAYGAAGRTAPRWADPLPALATAPIRGAHLMELRAAVVALE